MLTISKAFTIFFLLSLCGNREYPSSFQNKSVSSSFKWVPKYILFLAKLKGERSPFYREQTWIYSLNYLLHAGVMLTIIKVFIVLFVLCMWEQGTPWQFSKQINKLSFQLSVQVSFFLANLKRRGRPFLEGARKRGGAHWEITPRALGCPKRWKSLFFCEIWSNPTPPLLLTRPPYK